MARTFLSPPSQEESINLVSLLWRTQECSECQQQNSCRTNTCINMVLSRQKLFLRYYATLTAFCKSETSVRLIITNHKGLLDVIEILRSKSSLEKAAVRAAVISHFHLSSVPNISAIEDAIDLALEAMLMVQMPKRMLSPRIIESGGGPLRWAEDICLQQFLSDYLSINDASSSQQKHCITNDSFLDNLMARKLVKHCKIEFIPTNDMRDHLLFDREHRTVLVFHHVTFIAELLRMTRYEETDLAGLLPRRFVLEVLDSIQLVLFPLTDTRSNRLLRSLIADKGLDPGCASWELSSSEIRREDEKIIQFDYFQSRLLSLFDELQDPSPKDNWEHWLERRSGKRYAMLATLIGVAVAIFLGLAGLAVGILQAYFTYQSWKHPVTV